MRVQYIGLRIPGLANKTGTLVGTYIYKLQKVAVVTWDDKAWRNIDIVAFEDLKLLE